MRQFHVPQFIMIEDRVIGPFTIKQALYLGGGAVLIFAAWTFLESFIFFPIAALVGSFMGSLAFLKINGQPFPSVLRNAVFYTLRPRLYTWQKRTAAEKLKPATPKAEAEEIKIKTIPRLEESRLSDLAWSLDVKGSAQKSEQ